jgi:hypothetical protein
LKTKTMMSAIAVALLLALAGCGSAAAPKAAPTQASAAAAAVAATPAAQQTDPNGQECASLDSLGYCPGDDPETDPNGQQCPSLDSLGYCPGDDPSPLQQWCSGNGYSDFQQVSEDLGQLQTDTGNEDLAAVEQDGASLFQDAHAAALGLPPLSNAHKVEYGVWFGYVMVSGYKASQGDINGAVSALEDASKYSSIVTYVGDQCGG